jgi:hypothetical protein
VLIFGEHINQSSLDEVLKNKYSHTHNLHFQYITREEFNKIKSESPELAYGDFFNV